MRVLYGNAPSPLEAVQPPSHDIFVEGGGGGGSSNTLLIVACSRLDVGRESGSRNGEAEPVSIVFSIVLVDLKTGQL